MIESAIDERRLEVLLNRLAAGWAPVDPERLAEMAAGATQAGRAGEEVSADELPRRGRRSAARIGRRRVGAVLSAAAALVVLAIVAGGLLFRPSPAAAGVEFTNNEGFIVARVTDPMVSAAQLNQAFVRHGLDIELQLVPASPSLVGTVVAIEEGGTGIEALQGGTCLTGGGGCPVGLRIPATYRGHAQITLARQARPGETFVASSSALAPGEPLHCSGLAGMTVRTAAELLRARGLTAVWRPYRDSGDVHVDRVTFADYFVIDADSMAPGDVMIWISPTPVSELNYPALERYLKGLSRGC